MYTVGSIATLLVSKDVGSSGDTVSLHEGTCGMIVNTRPDRDRGVVYAVDFGPYGQCYCYEDEIRVEGQPQPSTDEIMESIFGGPEPEENDGEDPESDPFLDAGERPAEAGPIDFDADVARRMKEMNKIS